MSADTNIVDWLGPLRYNGRTYPRGVPVTFSDAELQTRTWYRCGVCPTLVRADECWWAQRDDDEFEPRCSVHAPGNVTERQATVVCQRCRAVAASGLWEVWKRKDQDVPDLVAMCAACGFAEHNRRRPIDIETRLGSHVQHDVVTLLAVHKVSLLVTLYR